MPNDNVWNSPGESNPDMYKKASFRQNNFTDMPLTMASGVGPNGEKAGTGGNWVFDQGLQRWRWQVNEKYAMDQALANAPKDNSLGDQYQTNQSYTPFGLQPSNVNTGQYGLPGAFGGNYGSDLLVPQLEQRRMQRIIQAYPQGGG